MRREHTLERKRVDGWETRQRVVTELGEVDHLHALAGLDLVARWGDGQNDFLPARYVVKNEFAQQRLTSLRLARDLRQTDLVQKLGCDLLDI